jgi:methyl-accepting chemotaxis protein
MIFFLLSVFFFLYNRLSDNAVWEQKSEIKRNVLFSGFLTLFSLLQFIIFFTSNPVLLFWLTKFQYALTPLFFLFLFIVLSHNIELKYQNTLRTVFYITGGIYAIFAIFSLFSNLLLDVPKTPDAANPIIITPIFRTVYMFLQISFLFIQGVTAFFLVRSNLSKNKRYSMFAALSVSFIVVLLDIFINLKVFNIRVFNISFSGIVLVELVGTITFFIEYYYFQVNVRKQEGLLSSILEKLKNIIHNGQSTIYDLQKGSSDIKTLSIEIQSNAKENEHSIDETLNYTNNEKSHIKNFSTMVISNISTFENILDSMMVQNKKVEDFSVIFKKVIEIIEDISSKGRIVSSGVVNLSAVIKEAKEKAIDNHGIINEIHTHIRNIQNVNKTIDKISDDANVLAMNAAIESANNAAFGSGFMVVAEDLKELSVKTKQETAEIEQILNYLQRDINLGIDAAFSVMEFFSKLENTIDIVFNYIINIVDHTKTLMDEIEKSNASLSSLVEITSEIASHGIQQKDLNNELNESIIEVKFMIESIRRAMENEKELIKNSFQFSEFISQSSNTNDIYTFELYTVFNEIQTEIQQTGEATSNSDMKLVE